MLDLQTTLVVAAAMLTGATILAAISAWCFRGWLDLKRMQLGAAGTAIEAAPREPTAMNRIEVADLKERVRRLEAIAAGVEL